MKAAAVPGPMGEAGAIIVYRLPPGLPMARRVRFGEKVWGQVRSSGGRRSRRHGVLERVRHWKVTRGVVIVRAEDGLRVVRELKRWNAKVEWWPIRLEPDQLRQLRSRLS